MSSILRRNRGGRRKSLVPRPPAGKNKPFQRIPIAKHHFMLRRNNDNPRGSAPDPGYAGIVVSGDVACNFHLIVTGQLALLISS